MKLALVLITASFAVGFAACEKEKASENWPIETLPSQSEKASAYPPESKGMSADDKPTPPPLLPPKEDSPPLHVVARETEPEPEGAALQGIWVWRDTSGTLHSTDNEAHVPEVYRERAVFRESTTPNSDANMDATLQNQAEDQALAQARERRAQRESQCALFAKRGADLLNAIKAARDEREHQENNAPDCASQAVPGLGGTFDPQCEERWQRRKETARRAQETAEESLADLREEARRADLSASCVPGD